MKTLLFCTSYADTPHRWQSRYRKWLDYVSRSAIARDQVLLVDDGSASLPEWRGLAILRELPDKAPADKTVLFHFADNLGRPALLNYPGWFRSFALAAEYARKFGFDKIVHIESDSYVYSDRLVRFINGLSSGWTTFWCPSQGFPETCIQVVCADRLEDYLALSHVSYAAELANRAIETLLPFTDVRKDFIGDRYGEIVQWLPEDADYGCQIPDDWPV